MSDDLENIVIFKTSTQPFKVSQKRKPEDDDKRKPGEDDDKRKPEDDDKRRDGSEDDDKQRRKPYEDKQGEDVTIVEGYITTYGNPDIVGDVIQQGALDDFIDRFNAGEVQLRMLFQHNRASIIGQWTELRSDDFGVYAVGEIFEDVTLGADIATLVRRGILDSFSIGFTFDENGFEIRRDGGRLFTKIDLFETSIVDVPANPRAQITDVKMDDNSIDLVKLEKLLRDAGCSRKESKVIVHAAKPDLRKAEEAEQKEQFLTNLLNKLNKE